MKRRDYKELKNKRFGNLTVIGIDQTEYRYPSGKLKIKMLCKCDCGRVKSIVLQTLKNGETKSCGCYKLKKLSENIIDLTGQRFGKLTVLYKTDIKKNRDFYWNCLCDCGVIKNISGNSLRSNRTKSCGCLHKEIVKAKTKENHWNWDKNKTSEERFLRRDSQEHKKWASDVKFRDKFLCNICNKQEKHLEAHHLYPYAINKDKRFDISNGITLCKKHHKEFHKTYGYDCNLEQFIEFKNNHEIYKI